MIDELPQSKHSQTSLSQSKYYQRKASHNLGCYISCTSKHVPFDGKKATFGDPPRNRFTSSKILSVPAPTTPMRTFGVPAALQTNSTKLKVKNYHKYNFMNGKSRLLDQTAQLPVGYHLISNNSKTPPLQTIDHLKKIASPQLKLNFKILEKKPHLLPCIEKDRCRFRRGYDDPIKCSVLQQ